MDNRAIGIFDSGVGGLSVLREVTRLLPNENIIYFGDTARNPYGNRSRDELLKFACEIINFLLVCDVKLIILACNTISSTCLGELKKIYDLPIINVLDAGVKAFTNIDCNQAMINIIGTEQTIASCTYENKIFKCGHGHTHTHAIACPLLVKLVEDDHIDDDLSYRILKNYLSGFKKNKSSDVHALLLACTHYSFFESQIKKIIDPHVKIIDPAIQTAINAQDYLVSKDLISHKNKSEIIFYTSGDIKKFILLTNKLLDKNFVASQFKSKCFNPNS